MSIDDIRKFRNATPFKPFDLVLSDGSAVHVSLPERIALSPSGLLAGVFQGSDLSFVEVSRVTALKPNRHAAPRIRRAK